MSAKDSSAPEAPEVAHVHASRVACDGGEGAMGHPRVFLSLKADGKVECPYCDKLYILDGPVTDSH